MRTYSDGTKVEVDENRLLIRVYGDPVDGNFEISGFESLSDIQLFLDFGDFSSDEENDFYAIAGKKTKLHWVFYD